MMVAAIPPIGSVSQTILIRKITIVETAPPTQTFQMSPSAFTENCGYPIIQTFTVTNPGGITGITGYTWDLRPPPNGWIHNGNPAPQIITTSVNTLQLSSACNNTGARNVSATVFVNNAPHSSVISLHTFNNSLPSFTVNGIGSICNSNPVTYNIAEALPCDASVSWTASPAGIVSLSPSGNTVQLTKIAEGAVILTVNISSGCGNTTTTKNIALVGIPVVNRFDIIQSFCLGGRKVQIQVNPIDNNTSYRWLPPAHPGFLSPSTGPSTIVRSVIGNVPTGVIITVEATNTCGTSSFSENVGLPSCPDPLTAETTFSFDISPNPAKDRLLMTITEQSPEVKALIEEENISLRLYDLNSTMVIKRWDFKNTQTKFNLNISGIKKGQYILVVNKGKYQQSKHIMIE